MRMLGCRVDGLRQPGSDGLALAMDSRPAHGRSAQGFSVAGKGLTLEIRSQQAFWSVQSCHCQTRPWVGPHATVMRSAAALLRLPLRRCCVFPDLGVHVPTRWALLVCVEAFQCGLLLA